ncbi:hypothetical protein BU14_0258s0007 [Porphyra umbilicalis]|uniref:Uncharacterized protein n=1 Tax=Porphyra umbilicalis TaxID=2786 RepID=A0A1X6P297_PORUM|nr:hypothetical protein BU14_0258s0007 [Porphyra umbilicalis]|eukprot:OSX75002.1 hypothetical protein BU14_0258s0007 [Porphyra umbilicalis]
MDPEAPVPYVLAPSHPLLLSPGAAVSASRACVPLCEEPTWWVRCVRAGRRSAGLPPLHRGVALWRARRGGDGARRARRAGGARRGGHPPPPPNLGGSDADDAGADDGDVSAYDTAATAFLTRLYAVQVGLRRHIERLPAARPVEAFGGRPLTAAAVAAAKVGAAEKAVAAAVAAADAASAQMRGGGGGGGATSAAASGGGGVHPCRRGGGGASHAGVGAARASGACGWGWVGGKPRGGGGGWEGGVGGARTVRGGGCARRTRRPEWLLSCPPPWGRVGGMRRMVPLWPSPRRPGRAGRAATAVPPPVRPLGAPPPPRVPAPAAVVVASSAARAGCGRRGVHPRRGWHRPTGRCAPCGAACAPATRAAAAAGRPVAARRRRRRRWPRGAARPRRRAPAPLRPCGGACGTARGTKGRESGGGCVGWGGEGTHSPPRRRRRRRRVCRVGRRWPLRRARPTPASAAGRLRRGRAPPPRGGHVRLCVADRGGAARLGGPTFALPSCMPCRCGRGRAGRTGGAAASLGARARAWATAVV